MSKVIEDLAAALARDGDSEETHLLQLYFGDNPDTHIANLVKAYDKASEADDDALEMCIVTHSYSEAKSLGYHGLEDNEESLAFPQSEIWYDIARKKRVIVFYGVEYLASHGTFPEDMDALVKKGEDGKLKSTGCKIVFVSVLNGSLESLYMRKYVSHVHDVTMDKDACKKPPAIALTGDPVNILSSPSDPRDEFHQDDETSRKGCFPHDTDVDDEAKGATVWIPYAPHGHDQFPYNLGLVLSSGFRGKIVRPGGMFTDEHFNIKFSAFYTISSAMRTYDDSFSLCQEMRDLAFLSGLIYHNPHAIAKLFRRNGLTFDIHLYNGYDFVHPELANMLQDGRNIHEMKIGVMDLALEHIREVGKG